MSKLDLILNKFHKAKPADTPTYNIYHDQAKTEIKDLIKELIDEATEYHEGRDETFIRPATLRKAVDEI